MTAFIDKKYINIISDRLDKFKWAKGNLANCRCPICGDSQKNKSKARFIFMKAKINILLSVITVVILLIFLDF